MNKYTKINYSYHETEEPTEVSIKRPADAKDPWAFFNMLHVMYIAMGNDEGNWIDSMMTYLSNCGILNFNEGPMDDPAEESKLTILS